MYLKRELQLGRLGETVLRKSHLRADCCGVNQVKVPRSVRVSRAHSQGGTGVQSKLVTDRAGPRGPPQGCSLFLENSGELLKGLNMIRSVV